MLNRKNSFSKAFKIATTRTKYSLKGEDEVGKKIQKGLIKAKNVPHFCYVQQKGGSLEQAMTMLHILKMDNLSAYLGVYMDESLYCEDQLTSYYFVLYHDSNLSKWYVANFEPVGEPLNRYKQDAIPFLRFLQERKEIWIYNVYDFRNGQLPLFGGFFKKPLAHLNIRWLI